MNALLAALLFFKVVDPSMLVIDDKNPTKTVSAPLDAGRQYAIRKVEASSADAFCISVLEVLGDAGPPRMVASGCFPGGPVVFTFDHGESKIRGAAGRFYTIVAARPEKEATDTIIFVRAVIEVRNLQRGE